MTTKSPTDGPFASLTIAIAGLGTVGAEAARILQQSTDLLENRCGRKLTLTAVSARNKSRDRGFSMENITWHDNAADLASLNNVDIIVELIGGEGGIAKELVETALKNGKHVVTANKALIAHHGLELSKTAENNNLALAFEAAVAGGIPILKAIREGFTANTIKRVTGILNGTCNYILDQMEITGKDFDTVLTEAQKLGYAEADPTFDVDGIDTAHKLAILTSLAYGTAPDLDSVHIEGIRNITFADIEYAAQLGYRIKLLGAARPTEHGIEQRVHPTMVKDNESLAQVPDVFNAIALEGDAVGTAFLQGRGAGAGPTASAVIADILDIARGNTSNAFSTPASMLKPLKPAPIDTHSGAYYLRLAAIDKPGVLSAVSTALSKEGISIEQMIQRGHAPGEPVQLVMITHPTVEAHMQAALTQIEKLEFIKEPPHMIRIKATSG